MTPARDIERLDPHWPTPCGSWRLVLAGASLLAGIGTAQAQDAGDPALRRQLADERGRVEARYQQQRLECSQRFFVTTCMEQARAERRTAIEALDRREAEIDRQLRHERARQRLALIQQKTEAQARLAPLPADQPAEHATPAAAEEDRPSQVAGRSGAESRDDSRAAAERAARARAEASQRRRAEAERRRIEREQHKAQQKKPAAGLPGQPLIPPPTE